MRACAPARRSTSKARSPRQSACSVHWSDRLCRTFTPARAKQVAAAENKLHLIVVPATQTTTR
jgi:hypothetical protein